MSDNRKGNQKLRLSKIGKVTVRLHRAIKGNIKTCMIKRELDKWYVCFTCEVEPEILPKTRKDAGIDVGIEKFAALSDGVLIYNPEFLQNQALPSSRDHYPVKEGSNSIRNKK